MQHQQRSPGPPVASDNNRSENNLSATPTKKTRRGKRGGRGRSLSPRTGLPTGPVLGGGGRAAGMSYHTASGSWFPSHQRNLSGPHLGHGSPSPLPPFLLCQQQQQQQQQEQQHYHQHQQREQREETMDMRPQVAAATTMTAVAASAAAWGNQVSRELELYPLRRQRVPSDAQCSDKFF